MSDADKGLLFFILMVAAGCFCCGGCVGGCLGRQDERRNATATGVGRWVVDEITGKTEFKYGCEK